MVLRPQWRPKSEYVGGRMETSSPVPTKHTFYQSPVCVEETSTKSELGGSASVFVFMFLFRRRSVGGGEGGWLEDEPKVGPGTGS